MKVSDLLSIFGDVKWGDGADQQVVEICFDSRALKPGCVFIAIAGTRTDGHQFLKEAAVNGALAVVVENERLVPVDYSGTIACVPSTREALNKIADRFFGSPSRELFCVGVTGTNGKTTITHMVEAILNRHGYPTGVIGTINHHLGTKVWETELTTPDPLSFQRRLREFKDLGAAAVAMEVSSIGLRQSRVDEVQFDVAVFTNLSRDHLDYHRDMDDYFDAKRRLYQTLLPRSSKKMRVAVVNSDDSYGQRLIKENILNCETWSYGLAENADLRFELIEQGFAGTRFRVVTSQGSQEMRVAMPGLHNVYNALGAIGAALCAGVTLQSCAAALLDFKGVKGRLEDVPNERGIFVYVDYAHTDGAISTVLHYLNAIRSEAKLKNRIITVFGCGGDRDKGKRPLMARAALQGSDLVVVTSDNPRSEDPQAIVDDALKGVSSLEIGQRVFPVLDRRAGICKALDLARAGDVVLIAGKGHEDYQQIGTEKFPFSDVEVAKEFMR